MRDSIRRGKNGETRYQTMARLQGGVCDQISWLALMLERQSEEIAFLKRRLSAMKAAKTRSKKPPARSLAENSFE